MKKISCIFLFLVGCSLPVESEVKEFQEQPDVEVIGKPITELNSNNTLICNGEEEIREVEINGERHVISIPILCTEQWQNPSDPADNNIFNANIRYDSQK